MKNIFKGFAALALAMLISVNAFAGFTIQRAGTTLGASEYLNVSTGCTVAYDGSVSTLVCAAGAAAITSGSIVGLTTFAAGGAVGAANSWQYVSNGIEFEGATADAFETTLSAVDPTVDQTISLPNNGASSAVVTSLLTTNAVDAANSAWFETGSLVFEGATANGFEGRLTASDWTADQVHTLPDMTGAVFMSTLATNNLDVANSVWAISNGINFEGATADAFELTLAPADVTADRTATFPDQTGTVQLSGVAVVLTAGTTVTMTVLPGNRLFTDTITTDAQNQTINASGVGAAGDEITIIFTTDAAGSGAEVITFGTNMRSTGTLTLANGAATRYVMTWISDGGKWNEKSRTAVQAA